MPGNAIGAIDIFDRHSYVDVPGRYVKQVLESMEGSRIRGQDARIRVATAQEREAADQIKRLKHKGMSDVPRKKGGKKTTKRHEGQKPGH